MLRIMKQANNLLVWLILIQGIYFYITGAWPVLHIESFLKVTCPKTDTWLVKTFGAVLMCIGTCFIAAALKKSITFSVIMLAMLSAFTLAAVDIYYVSRNVICRIYLADAAVETSLLIALIICAATIKTS